MVLGEKHGTNYLPCTEEKGRAEGMSAGIQREQKLTRSLLGDNRLDDLKRALDDPAFRQKLCEEYGID